MRRTRYQSRVFNLANRKESRECDKMYAKLCNEFEHVEMVTIGWEVCYIEYGD